MSNSHAPKQMMTMSKADTQKMLSEAGIDASKVSVLDKSEMVKTEGEFWPNVFGAAIGGGSAAWGYLGSLGNRPMSWGHLGTVTAVGAVRGGLNPIRTGVQAATAFGLGTAGGFATGRW